MGILGSEVYRPPAHHVFAGPGLRSETKNGLVASFNLQTLDLEAVLPVSTSEAIVQFELPHICDSRPHADANVEAWLQKWLDGVDCASDRIVLEARCLPQLKELLEERPEVCPILQKQLRLFEAALSSWLMQWPVEEPERKGIMSRANTSSSKSASDMELELHAVLLLLGGCKGDRFLEPLLPAPEPLEVDASDRFRQVALGWIFKLHSLHGLSVLTQHERMAAAPEGGASHLSLLSWTADEVLELLQCPFFRPPESELLDFVQRWFSEGVGDAESRQENSAAISEALLWELLPQKDSVDAVGQTLPQRKEAQDESRVPGNSFFHVERHLDCALKSFDQRDAFHIRTNNGSTRLHCWNCAKEEQVIGASRQLVASNLAMSSTGGRFRVDLRVNAGTESEAAHLFEVGIMASPSEGVCFDARAFGASCPRPTMHAEDNKGSPFYHVVTLPDVLLEGVRLAVEVDFDEAIISIRNIPDTESSVTSTPPSSIAKWLTERSRLSFMQARTPGELDCPLFKEHVHHLHDLIQKGTLEKDLADAVLADVGAQLVLSSNLQSEKPEAYHFYVVVPAGLELDIF